MVQVNIQEAQVQLLDLIQEALKGQEIVIFKDNQPLVQLTPFHSPTQRRLGGAKGKFKMMDNFNEPLEDFADYT